MDKISSAHIVGGNHRGDRVKEDFYPSTPECVYSYLHYEREHLRGKKVWEPSCGDGAISKILEADGFKVYSTDLVYRGYGSGGKDFLWTMETDCDAIVTNPPFKIAEDFIVHALQDLKVGYLALLLKSHYWHAKTRHALFMRHRPTIIYPMLWRPDFLKRGAPTMDFQWTVWRGPAETTLYEPMQKITG